MKILKIYIYKLIYFLKKKYIIYIIIMSNDNLGVTVTKIIEPGFTVGCME